MPITTSGQPFPLLHVLLVPDFSAAFFLSFFLGLYDLLLATPSPAVSASPSHLLFGQILIALRLLYTELVVHLFSALTDVFALAKVVDVCEPLLGLPLRFGQDVLDLWVVLGQKRAGSVGVASSLPSSRPPHRPGPIPNSQNPQAVWSKRNRHNAKPSLSSPGSPRETQAWPVRCGQSGQDTLSCFLCKQTYDTFLQLPLTSETRSSSVHPSLGFLVFFCGTGD